MKKLFALLLALALVFSFAACGGGTTESEAESESGGESEATALNVVYLVNGNLGDKSFFDSAESGLVALESEGLITKTTIEMGPDEATWQSYVEEVTASGEYDIVVVGTWQMPTYVLPVAEANPDQKYIIFDTEVLDADGNYLPNIASIQYNQNDMGYLVGVFAGMMELSELEGLNDENIIGFVGGMDSPVICDFLVGYIEGARSVNPDVMVDWRWINSYVDTALGKEIGAAEIQAGADIIWGCGGNAGSAAVEACAEAGVWFIGVDSDQELTLAEEYAAVTLTSGLKNCGTSLEYVIKQYLEGNESAWGTCVYLGLAEGGVGIVTDKNFATYGTAEAQEAVAAAEEAIRNGEIVVNSAFDADFDYYALMDEVKSGS
ncbi:MAG: BMP family ABC transporter substrate-binding protein [Oscillospiraceae bacterium]|nr:BMP family ABC transporter substrate-binding protein [Oscillospiraceae bacterium]